MARTKADARAQQQFREPRRRVVGRVETAVDSFLKSCQTIEFRKRRCDQDEEEYCPVEARKRMQPCAAPPPSPAIADSAETLFPWYAVALTPAEPDHESESEEVPYEPSSPAYEQADPFSPMWRRLTELEAARLHN